MDAVEREVDVVRSAADLERDGTRVSRPADAMLGGDAMRIIIRKRFASA